uniref:Uncharacterized protein n=1 Tax=Myoviridae sp. ct0jJ30 TaxID=2825014 RepID=A0A8S5PI11_9CAUD|nr:MAG TPA: hypothetical protein [Myoviridae sp. ct0jJ30]
MSTLMAINTGYIGQRYQRYSRLGISTSYVW